MLTIENLTIQCREQTIVRNINVELHDREVAVFVGNSGSGKSVTVSSILGLIRGDVVAAEGNISYEADEISFSADAGKAEAISRGLKKTGEAAYGCIRGKEISMIFQEHNSALNPLFTVGQHMSDTLLSHGKCAETDAKLMSMEWVKRVCLGNSEEFLSKYPEQLSGGEAQRLMIALALCTNPRLLIADEPTTNLDASIQTSIIELITGFLNDGNNRLSSLLLVTHDIRNIERIITSGERAVKIVYFEKNAANIGRALETRIVRSMEQLFSGWQADSARLFFDRAREKLVQGIYSPSATGRNILEMINVRKYFRGQRGLFDFRKNNTGAGEIKAVDDASLTVREGEILGLVGESGSGKSTIGRLIVRLCSPDSGELLLYPFTAPESDELNQNAEFKEVKAENGAIDITKIPEKKFRENFQMIFQSPDIALNSMMKVRGIMEEAVTVRNRNLSTEEVKKEIETLLQKVGLKYHEIADKYPFELSGGQKRRIGIARILAVKPRFIVADEPIAEIDVTAQFGIIDLLKKLRDEESLTLLVISHDFDMIKGLCDRIAVMYKSRIVEIGRTIDLMRNPGHPYTRALLQSSPVADSGIVRSMDGCNYISRCGNEKRNEELSLCEQELPVIKRHSETYDHECACHFPGNAGTSQKGG